MRRVVGVLLFMFLLTLGWAFDVAEMKRQFPNVNSVNTAQLRLMTSQSLIVDVRSYAEYVVAHVTGAYNIPLAELNGRLLDQLLQEHPKPNIVFYCTGASCGKSFHAASLAMARGYQNVYAYEGGFMTWFMEAPDLTTYMGLPAKSSDYNEYMRRLFASQQLMLSAGDFMAKFHEGGYTIVDVRPMKEHHDFEFNLNPKVVIEINTLFDELAKGNRSILPASKLLIVHNMAYEDCWLYFYFQKLGITDVYFLKGGINKWIQDKYDANGKQPPINP